METQDHLRFMRLALETADNCCDIEWYGVGCIIVSPEGEVLSSGYTGEIKEESGKYRHAEDVAIAKAKIKSKPLKGALLYSTMEPCSIRASGKTPCISRIIECGIGTVVFGAREPYDPALGIVCEGEAKLDAAGIEVIHLADLERECLDSVYSKRKGLA